MVKVKLDLLLLVIQSVTWGIREYMECLKKFGRGVSRDPIQNFFRHSVYSHISPVTDCITNLSWR